MDEDEFKRILGAPTDEDLAAGLTLIPQRIRQEVVPTVTVEALYAPTVRLARISILTLVRRQYTPTLPEYHVFPR